MMMFFLFGAEMSKIWFQWVGEKNFVIKWVWLFYSFHAELRTTNICQLLPNHMGRKSLHLCLWVYMTELTISSCVKLALPHASALCQASPHLAHADNTCSRLLLACSVLLKACKGFKLDCKELHFI